jgi:hypothetical protein
VARSICKDVESTTVDSGLLTLITRVLWAIGTTEMSKLKCVMDRGRSGCANFCYCHFQSEVAPPAVELLVRADACAAIQIAIGFEMAGVIADAVAWLVGWRARH